MYSYNQVSDYFIALSNITNDLITNLRLQKLMYYAQAWYYTINGEKLFDEKFEAWVHGPVIRRLYGEYKSFSFNPIIREDLTEKEYEEIRNSFDPKDLEFFDEIVNKYFGLSAYELERLTHAEKPWQIARGNLEPFEPCTETIREEWMKDYYSQYLN